MIPFFIDLHERQWEVYQSKARFRVLVAGRRFGKTHLALAEMLRAATDGPGRVVWYVGPNDSQSKRIAWKRLKELTREYWAKQPSETAMCIELTNGSTLTVHGAFHPDSLRGEGLDFLVIDESASLDPRAWIEVLRPALADRQGRVLFIGTPQGRNHFFYLFEHAQNGDPDWEAFQFTTAQGGLVTPNELAAAARDLDPDSFRQEMEGHFTNTNRHRAYRAFDKVRNVKPVRFDNLHPLVWSLDFNINPMCMLLMQQVEDIVYVLEEIVIKPEAHTEMACERFLARALAYYQQVPAWQRPLTLQIYGDAAGIQRRTSGSHTDWELIKQFLNTWHGTFNPKFFIASRNPPVRDRVNCVNSRLHNQAGDTRLFIDPGCKELIRDLEEISWAIDSTGSPTHELNKSDLARTHASDALGYFITQQFPMRGKIGEIGSGPILSF